jgi:hypothetical protein
LMIGLLSRTPVHDDMRCGRPIRLRFTRKQDFLTSFVLIGN